MTQLKFTPGPWFINDNGHYLEVGGTNSGDIAELCPSQYHYDNGDRNGPVTKANAQLIVAAPELFEALRQLRNHVQDCYHSDADAKYWNDEHHPMNLAKLAMNKVLGGE